MSKDALENKGLVYVAVHHPKGSTYSIATKLRFPEIN